MKDLYRAELYKLAVKKVSPKSLLNYFLNIKASIETEISDSHLTVIDGYQARIFNLLSDIEGLIRILDQKDTLPNKVVKTLESL